MLTEIRNSRLASERRRLFSDEYMDLFLWHDHSGRVIGFQVCFDKQYSEKAFTWLAPGYSSLAEVDQGEESPLRNRSPILVQTKSVNLGVLLDEFRARATKLEPQISRQVEKAIEELVNQAL